MSGDDSKDELLKHFESCVHSAVKESELDLQSESLNEIPEPYNKSLWQRLISYLTDRK